MFVTYKVWCKKISWNTRTLHWILWPKPASNQTIGHQAFLTRRWAACVGRSLLLDRPRCLLFGQSTLLQRNAVHRGLLFFTLYNFHFQLFNTCVCFRLSGSTKHHKTPRAQLKRWWRGRLQLQLNNNCTGIWPVLSRLAPLDNCYYTTTTAAERAEHLANNLPPCLSSFTAE